MIYLVASVFSIFWLILLRAAGSLVCSDAYRVFFQTTFSMVFCSGCICWMLESVALAHRTKRGAGSSFIKDVCWISLACFFCVVSSMEGEILLFWTLRVWKRYASIRWACGLRKHIPRYLVWRAGGGNNLVFNGRVVELSKVKSTLTDSALLILILHKLRIFPSPKASMEGLMKNKEIWGKYDEIWRKNEEIWRKYDEI